MGIELGDLERLIARRLDMWLALATQQRGVLI
jgi:hypothetical protein